MIQGGQRRGKKKSMRMDLRDTCKGRTAGIGWLLGCWGVKSGEADDTEILSSAVCEDGEAFTGARGRGVGGGGKGGLGLAEWKFGSEILNS